MINRFDYLTSDFGIKPEARNIWYKLMIDDNYYFYTSEKCSGVINKKISDDRLKEIINNIKLNIENIYYIKYNNLIFDDKLKEKLI